MTGAISPAIDVENAGAKMIHRNGGDILVVAA
jgi:hypothetical protein